MYVEAHGTGTPVGDPIEATALGRVLSRGRADSAPCRIASVKTNLGHLEPAAGIAGVIKAALILDRGIIPPNRNFEKLNPSIPFGDLKLQVVTKAEALGANGCRSVVGVN
jgi:acyl transferase domain-containing protein